MGGMPSVDMPPLVADQAGAVGANEADAMALYGRDEGDLGVALARERYCAGAATAVSDVGGAAAASTAAVAAAFIEPCYERVDTTTKTAQRQQAVARFNASGAAGTSGGRWLFLQHTRSCGVGTDLPGIDVAIFLDSDWSARKDAQVLGALLAGAIPVGEPLRGDEEQSMHSILSRPPLFRRAAWFPHRPLLLPGVHLTSHTRPAPSPCWRPAGAVARAAGGVPWLAARVPPVLPRHLRGAPAAAV